MKTKTKNILIIVLAIALIIAITIIVFLSNNKEKIQNLELQGKVIIVGEDYIIIESNNTDYLINNSKGQYKEGDIIKVNYNNNALNDASNPKVLKITDEELVETISQETENTTNNVNNDNVPTNQTNNVSNNLNDNKDNTQSTPNNNPTKPNNSTTNQSNNINNNNSSTSSNNSINNADTEVLNYFNTLNDDFNSESIKDSLKNGFITVVDFLFYNGQIKGYTFNELSSSAKLKVLSMAMYFDSKIENYFPGYKESISNTTSKIYTNLKEKVVNAYLNITTSICNNKADACESAKEGFNELKTNFGLTWSLIKDIAGDGITNLKNWYEIWSGK